MINMQLPATLGSRFIALFIDFCVIAAYALCLAAVTFAFYEYVLGGIPDIWGTVGAAGAHLIGFVTLTLPVGLYLFLTETSRHHATLGKRIANITVVSMRKKAVSKKQILIRTVIKLLPWEFAHTFIYQIFYYSNNSVETPVWVMVGLYAANIIPLVYLMTVIARKDHAGPHDLLAGTIVMARNKI
jgi:uncharacterized RDD family membrane protein YckC